MKYCRDNNLAKMSMENIQKLEDMKEVIGGWGEVATPRLDRILKYAGNTILDVGCGNGGYVSELSKRGYVICGIDLLPQSYNQKVHHRIIKGSVTDLPFKNESFDTILLFNVLEHVDDKRALREVYRICRKNIIFSVPRQKEKELEYYGITYHPYVDLSHLRYYTFDSLKNTLTDAGFKIKQIFYTYPINPLGLFLRMSGFPHWFNARAGAAIGKLPFIKKFYMNIEGIATKVK